MSFSSAIGIDLGTTHTVAAIYTDGKPSIIWNTKGNSLTPSVVFYDPTDLKSCVGAVAEDRSLRCPRNYMFDMKRIIGRNYYDVYVQQFVSMEESKKFPIQIIKSETSEEPVIKLEMKNESLTVTKSPEEVCSEILKYIKESAEERLDFEVREAVISVPAYFSYAQKAATRRAAEMAGFTVLKLITEPVAAAIHYTFKKKKTEENLLMFDLGGGTLDVSIISITQDTFTVKSVDGDMFLGGRDFDEIIFEYLRDKIGESVGPSYINQDTPKGQRFLQRLRNAAKKYKENLSFEEKYKIFMEVDNENECDIAITRETFEKLCEELFNRAMSKVEKCLQSAMLLKTDIHKVVLVGGSSRIPKIRRLLLDMFSQVKLTTDINADEAVALGASIHAALIKGQIENANRYRIREVAPFSVGIGAKYNLMVDFIKKGYKLPAIASQIMNTSENDQVSVNFTIFEGERKNCKYNNKLGDFTLYNIPARKVGDIDFNVTFHLDEDGVLKVTVMETTTEIESGLRIEMQNLTLRGNSMFLSLEEEVKLLKEDLLYDEFYRLKLKAESFCMSVLYNLQAANVRTGPIIERECINFQNRIDALNYSDIDILKLELDGFTKRTRTFFFKE